MLHVVSSFDWKKRSIALAALALAGVAAPQGARAASSPFAGLTITSTMTNKYTYSIGDAAPVTVSDADNVQLRLSSNAGGFVSALGLDMTTSLQGDSFYFQHDGYCIGRCGMTMETLITFTLENSGDDAVDLRWDSLVTPGHLGSVGNNVYGQFVFDVLQINRPNAPDEEQSGLYGAFGQTAGWYDEAPVGFNGLFRDSYSEGPGHANAWAWSDWSATNLNLDLLTIAPHSSSLLLYIAQVQVSSFRDCLSFADCDGSQVSFGDPRNTGGSMIQGLSSLALLQQAMAQPIVGREFDAYSSGSSFVSQDAPLPPTPAPLPPVDYTPEFVGQVPEPSTWAMLCLGFGAIGGVLRHGRRARRICVHLPQ